MLRANLQKILHIRTSSKHKELTKRGKVLHEEHVKNLKDKLIKYGLDPFSSDPPKYIPSGKEISESIVKDFIRAPVIGKSQMESFIKDRLIDGHVTFFVPIKRNKLLTGINKKPKEEKAVEILKEDCQAFGTMAAKTLSLREAFGYPITSDPLQVADLDGSLRQSDKSSFRNLLIEDAGV